MFFFSSEHTHEGKLPSWYMVMNLLFSALMTIGNRSPFSCPPLSLPFPSDPHWLLPGLQTAAPTLAQPKSQTQHYLSLSLEPKASAVSCFFLGAGRGVEGAVGKVKASPLLETLSQEAPGSQR